MPINIYYMNDIMEREVMVYLYMNDCHNKLEGYFKNLRVIEDINYNTIVFRIDQQNEN